MKRTKTDWTPKPAEDIMTMFSIFTHSKTAMEIYEKIGLYKFYRIHKAFYIMSGINLTTFEIVYSNEYSILIY